MEPILVIGAAGQARGADAAPDRRIQQGATGLRVTRELLKLGHEVRAFVRVDDERAAELRELGAEVYVGDVRNILDVAPALKGVQRAYFSYPVRVGMPEAVAVFAAAARDAGVQRIVDMSMIYAINDARVAPHMQRHWVAEQVFSAAVPEAVHLQAAVFYENMEVAFGNGGGRELPLPFGSPDTELPLVAAADVARVALALLTADEVDAAPLPLCGGVHSIGDVAAAFGVPYVDVAPDEWNSRAVELYRDPFAISHLASLWAMFKALGSGTGLFQVTESIERLTGRPPVTLQEFAAAR